MVGAYVGFWVFAGLACMGLSDIRDITVASAVASAVAPVRELPGAIDFDSALEQVALGFGLREGVHSVSIDTPYVPVTVRRQHLSHR